MEKERKHSCEWLKKLNDGNGDSSSVEINKNNEDHEWMLTLSSYYDQEDVELGEAQEDGDLASEVSIAINYCPFCGEKLENP